jgi:hypothetical protein
VGVVGGGVVGGEKKATIGAWSEELGVDSRTGAIMVDLWEEMDDALQLDGKFKINEKKSKKIEKIKKNEKNIREKMIFLKSNYV